MDVDGQLPMFISDYGSKIKEQFDKNGTKGIAKYITSNLQKWKLIPLNIAVAGATNVGKSTFINTIRGLDGDSVGAAAISVVHCTDEPKPYEHPDNNNLIFWDLPGFGTKKFKRDQYLKEVELDKYDFVLILSNAGFTEDDVWFAKSVKDHNKLFFFVRTRVDETVHGQKRNRRQQTEKEILDKIKEGCLNNFTGMISVENIFLIDCLDDNLYDFPGLKDKLLTSMPDIKREAMALSFSTFTKHIIEEKKKALRKRAVFVSCLSGIAGSVPVPGVGIAVDIPCLLEEATIYRKQFGLHEEGLDKWSRMLDIPVQDLSSTLHLKSTGIVLTVKGIVMFCRESFVKKSIEEYTKYAFPIVGSIISGVASFCATKFYLEQLLDLMCEDATKIHDHMISVVKETTQV